MECIVLHLNPHLLLVQVCTKSRLAGCRGREACWDHPVWSVVGGCGAGARRSRVKSS